MAKQCVVNRDENNNITSVLVKNPNNVITTDSMQVAIERNNGYTLDLAPNGKPSQLYQAYVDTMRLSDMEAKQEVSKVYSDEFIQRFGDWLNNTEGSSKVVDENTQPKLVWSGHPEKVENYNAYNNREEEDRIDNDAFFPENKSVADSYANAGFQMSREQAEKYKLPYRDAEPVFLNIRNPQTVDENSGLLITPLIEEAIVNGVDGFYGNTIHSKESKTWSVLDGNQVITAESLNLPKTEEIEGEGISYITSNLFNSLKQIPFLTEDQALDLYKNIYRPEFENLTENRDKLTGEPLLYFKADNGNIYSELSETLKNSASSYSMGFIDNQGGFQSFATSPIFEQTNVRGQIQSLIKDDYLKGEEKEPNTFEAQDSLASEMVEEELILTNPLGYTRNENNFTINEAETEKTINQLIKELGVLNGVKVALANKYFELKNRATKPKEVLYNESQLYNAIQSFMKRVGISETSIESYKDKYKAKFGVEVDANAFIDINNKIIATLEGKATLDELSEEVSHFIIEAWNQDEINRLLPYVKSTSYYSQFAETYREVYGKQISDPNQLERLVEREILGKMLAESMKNNFTMENKTEVERNFFQRLGDILRGFFEYMQNKVTSKEVNDIEFFTKQVSNLLYNEQLEASLENINPQSTAELMYSIPDSMDRLLKRFGNEINRSLPNTTEEELAIRGAVSIFNDRLSRASSLLNEIRKYVANEAIVPSNINILVDALISEREALELLKSETLRVANSKNNLRDSITTVRQIADQTLQTISELSGEIQIVASREPEIVARELLEETGEDRQYIIDAVMQNIENRDANGVRQAQKDTTWLGANFAHVGKMSNAFISLLNTIVKRMLNRAEINTNNDFKEFAEKLIPYQKTINKFFRGGSFLSTVNAEVVREQKLKYEYSIRKKRNDPALSDLTEEDFIGGYNNIDKIDKNSPIYFAYDYFYKKDYTNQDWSEKDRATYNNDFISKVESIIPIEELENGNSPLYVTLKNYSDRRSKYKEGDPLRKSENEQIAIDRKTTANIFSKDGNLKEGLSYMRYSEALARTDDSNIVSTNPKIEPTSNDFVVVIDRNVAEPLVGGLAFDMLKWNSINLSEKGDASTLRDNFRKEYDKKLNSLAGLTQNEKNMQLKDWVMENLQFDMSDSYWENLDFDGVNFKGLRDIVSSDIAEMLNQKETELNTLKLRRTNIIKLYKVAGDYKEIDADKIPAEDKLAIETLENEIQKVKNDIAKVFDEYGVSMYQNESSPIIELNQSFHKIFEKVTGTRFENASIDKKKMFFSGQYGMSAEMYSRFLNFEKTLSRTHSVDSIANKTINKYKNLAADPESLDSIREAYLKANAPSWYKRYDANTEYGNFVRDFTTGAISVEDLVADYLSTGEFRYKGNNLDMMQINPSFKYTLARTETTNELYEEYSSMPDNTVSDLKEKFNLLMRMGGSQDLKNIPKEDLSFILNNEENLRAYIYMMDYHLKSLSVSNSLNQYNVFTRPQLRKGGLERYENLVTKGNRFEQVKDALKERFQYRMDDFEDAYKTQQLPKYGLMKIDPSELTEDILGSLVWFNAQSNTYRSRIDSYGLALKAMSALTNQTFEKGKKATDTNYYKVAKGMLDYNFYGRTTTMKIETNVLGQKVDLAKVLMGFKGFAITQALAFSPIVALTNVASGFTQAQFLKWTGKNIYSNADDRAQRLLAPLTSNSLSDIGKLSPTSKLNKIMYSFGVYNIEERFKNAKYNKTARLLPEAGFGMMAVGNFALQSRVTVSKLMEVRLIDGKFQSWRDYTLEQKRLDRNITNQEMKTKYEEASTKSMYDYLNEDGNFDNQKLEADGYNGNIENDKLRTMSRIQDIGEQVIMEIRKHNEGEASRSPLWSFALSLKKWLILANTQMFSRRRVDLESGGVEEGLIFAYKNMFDLVNRMRKENITMSQAYSELEEVEKKNIRTTGIITASMTVLLALAFVLKKFADDDDEKDNYALQLGNYMLLRSLNETFSSNIGSINSSYEAISAPVATLSTVKNFAKVLDIRDIGTENKTGKYEGVDKYLSSWIKLTSAKNLYTLKDAETIGTTRQSYEHFSTSNSLFHIFSLIPKEEKEDK